MILRMMRLLGALAVLAVGAAHLQQYVGADFRTIPTIGPLFLLNAIGCGIVGMGLLMPMERVLAGRRAEVTVGLLAAGAVAIAIGSLVALFISESGSLFGFSESGYRASIVIAMVAEIATVLLLAPVAAINLTRALSRRRRPSATRDWSGQSSSDRMGAM